MKGSRRLNGALVVSTLVTTMALAPLASATVHPLEEGLRQLAATIVKKLEVAGLGKVAIAEFQMIDGGPSILGPYLAEELTAQLFPLRSSEVEFVERDRLADLLEEQRLNATGLFDTTATVEWGRLLGAEALVLGSITNLGKDLHIHCRVVSVQGGEVVAIAPIRLAHTAETLRLVNELPDAERASIPVMSTGEELSTSFQNSFVRLTLREVWPGKAMEQEPGNGSYEAGVIRPVAFLVEAENLTGTDLFIGPAVYGSRCDITLTTDSGFSAFAEQRNSVGLRCVRRTWTADHYNSIPSGGQAGWILKFVGPDVPLGRDATIIGGMFRFHGGRAHRFNFQIGPASLPSLKENP